MTTPARAETEIVVAGSGAMFDGHFPGHPILPGARLLDMIITAVHPAPVQVMSAKFLSTVAPGSRLRVQWSHDDKGGISFDCFQCAGPDEHDGADAPRLAATGKLRPL